MRDVPAPTGEEHLSAEEGSDVAGEVGATLLVYFGPGTVQT